MSMYLESPNRIHELQAKNMKPRPHIGYSYGLGYHPRAASENYEAKTTLWLKLWIRLITLEAEGIRSI